MPKLCGMIHLGALPGTPRYREPLEAVAGRALREAGVLAEAGFDAFLIENMHDLPYLKGNVGPEIVAAMTAVGVAIRREFPAVPLGVQILAGANRESLAVASAIGADFIRAEGFVFVHIGDEGIHESCAGELLRYRKAIDAQGIAVYADIKKKHSSHAVTSDVDLLETARAAEFFGAEGVVITGRETGQAADPRDLALVKEGTGLAVAIGSGLTPRNVEQFATADLLIAGSCLKVNGRWDGEMDPAAAREFVQAARTGSPRPS